MIGLLQFAAAVDQQHAQPTDGVVEAGVGPDLPRLLDGVGGVVERAEVEVQFFVSHVHRRGSAGVPAHGRGAAVALSLTAVRRARGRFDAIALPYAKDTREMATAIRAQWPDPGEIVFIEETALYGLRFYLGVPVERVTLRKKDEPALDSRLLEEQEIPPPAHRIPTADSLPAAKDPAYVC